MHFDALAHLGESSSWLAAAAIVSGWLFVVGIAKVIDLVVGRTLRSAVDETQSGCAPGLRPDQERRLNRAVSQIRRNGRADVVRFPNRGEK